MEKINLLNEFFNSRSDSSKLEATEQELLEKEFEEWFNEKMKDFEFAVEPAIRYLLKNRHPHCSIIIHYDSAELVEGLQCHNLINEVPD